MKTFLFVLSLFLIYPVVCLHASEKPAESAEESPTLEMQIGEGLRWVYLIQYDRARQTFDRIIKNNPDDPVGYFYRSAASWWQLFQHADNQLPDIEKQFLADTEKTIRLAKKKLKRAQDAKQRSDAYLYLGGAEGLRGRWLITQRAWLKAYFAGKRGHQYLHKALEENPEQYDAYLGLGIYDYFTDALSGLEAFVSAVLIRGDRARGIQQLNIALEKGIHSRTEAKLFLLEIYTWEENKPDLALKLVRELREEYPQSGGIHLMELMVYQKRGDWEKLIEESSAYISKCELGTPYYEHIGIPSGLYCKAYGLLYGTNRLAEAEAIFRSLLENKNPKSRWIAYGHLRLGQIYDLRGDREQALREYRKVLSRPNVWSTHKEANDFIKKPFEKKEHDK